MVKGIPADEILQEAKDHNADLIIMGSRGHGKLYEAVIGGTCFAVIRESNIPVLIITPHQNT